MAGKKKHSHAAKKGERTINLALQGGGAHGAFAWGVLDKLLEDGRIDVEGICATSAGAMNACAFAYGMHKGGRDGARESLHNFWQGISNAGNYFGPLHKAPWQNGFTWTIDNALSYFLFDTLTRTFSPYQFNPLDINPLRDVLAKAVDFDELRACDRVKLFISATHVETGKVRVFNTDEITLDAVMASACLPFLYKAVNVEGEYYWDGGYMGNPVLYPLFYNTTCRDVLIVHINPIERPELPTTAPDIMNRINEISFNSSLLMEIRAIAFVKKLLEQDMLKPEHRGKFKNMLIHSIRTDQLLHEMSVASKFDSSWDFLTKLRDLGRGAMTVWLDSHYGDIGVRGSVNLYDEYLSSITEMFRDHETHMPAKVA